MPRVICTLKNASSLISGIAFEPVDGVMLSQEIDDEVAAKFIRIPGYEWAPEPAPVEPEQQPVKSTDPDPLTQDEQDLLVTTTETHESVAALEQDTEAQEFEQLLARAKDLNIKVDSRWKVKRLKAEIDDAESQLTTGTNP